MGVPDKRLSQGSAAAVGSPADPDPSPWTALPPPPPKVGLPRAALDASLSLLLSSVALLLLLLLLLLNAAHPGASRTTPALLASLARPRVPRAAPSAGGLPRAPLRFLALGDWGRNGTHNQSLVADQMAVTARRLRAQFVVSTGDNFYEEGLADEAAAEFRQSFSAVYHHPELQLPWFAVLGNHDYYGNVLAQLSASLALRDVRWRCARSTRLSFPLCEKGEAVVPDGASAGKGVQGHAGRLSAASLSCPSLDLFLYDTTPLVRAYRYKKKYHTKVHMDWRGLNTEDWAAQEQSQLQELEGWLQASTATWKIVVGHHPVYSYGHHGSQPEMLASIKPLLEKYGVNIYMNGHDHNIQHIKNPGSSVHYLTNGAGSKAWREAAPPGPAEGLQYFWPGQGFGAFEVSDTGLSVLLYGVYGELLHGFTLTKPTDRRDQDFNGVSVQ